MSGEEGGGWTPRTGSTGEAPEQAKEIGDFSRKSSQTPVLIKLVKEPSLASLSTTDRLGGEQDKPSGKLSGFLRLHCSVGHRHGEEEEKEDTDKRG